MARTKKKAQPKAKKAKATANSGAVVAEKNAQTTESTKKETTPTTSADTITDSKKTKDDAKSIPTTKRVSTEANALEETDDKAEESSTVMKETTNNTAKKPAEPPAGGSTSSVEVDTKGKGGVQPTAKVPAKVSREDRLNKLHQLRMRKNEASKLNKKEVVEEDRISKLPKNWELKKRRVEWDMETDKAKKDAEARGQDYDRTKYLNMSIKEVEAMEEKREKKEQLMNKGFGDYTTAGTQSYQRNVSNIRVDKEEYLARREIAGDTFYAGVNDLTVGALGDGRVDNVDRMVNDLEKRMEKRQKMSRRRAFDEDGDINYINERNMRFNQKAERYYGKHTQEIKDSLERGTAL